MGTLSTLTVTDNRNLDRNVQVLSDNSIGCSRYAIGEAGVCTSPNCEGMYLHKCIATDIVVLQLADLQMQLLVLNFESTEFRRTYVAVDMPFRFVQPVLVYSFLFRSLLALQVTLLNVRNQNDAGTSDHVIHIIHKLAAHTTHMHV